MNWLDFFVKLNYKLYKRSVRWKNRALSPMRCIVRSSANYILPRYLKKRIEQHPQPMGTGSLEKIIVSLTSFPARMNNIWQTIMCLLLQSQPADRIILWLSKDQFGEDYKLPTILSTLVSERFEIRWVKGDLRSHKKYYYVAQEYPDSLVLLVDDDIYYPTDMLKRVLEAHTDNPDVVICQYGYQMAYDDDGVIQPYNSWEKVFNESDDPNLFFGSGGGTLIRFSSLYCDLLNDSLFTRLTPIADDVWLNAMVRLSGQHVKMIKAGHILPIANKDDVHLASENRRQNKNDEQIHEISSYYLSTIGVDPFARL